MTRIPSFNDFSPGIIADLRDVLNAVSSNPGNNSAIFKQWANLNFKGKVDTRSTTNARATLTSLGLLDSATMTLTAAALPIASASTKEEAAALLSAHAIKERNGLLLLKSIVALRKRDERVTKEALAKELKLYGVELSTGTTDHTTLANWMALGGLLKKDANYEPDDALIKKLTGLSTAEAYEWDSLPVQQQIFLQVLRRLAHVSTTSSVPTKQVYDECLAEHPALFDSDQLQKKVVKPLEDDGWLTVQRAAGRQGGKSGTVTACTKLLNIPMDALLPDYDAAIPGDLKSKINTPLADIRKLLKSASKNERGVGLELLSLRLLIDLGLNPRGFRVRSSDTGGAEVDLIAEGQHLLFSRWTVQCKHTTSSVHLAAVAKEVGIAMFSRSHVVVMISTNKFTQQAKDFARHITETTHLQFVFLDKASIDGYLKNGPQSLHKHFRENAKLVMQLKRAQPVEPAKDED